jgi:hypothetical protein
LLSRTRLVGLFGSISVVLALVLPAGASAHPAARLVVDEIRMPVQAASVRSGDGIAPPPCQDSAHKSEGGHQTSTYKWSFKASSTPSGLNRSSVRSVLQTAFNNITREHNDCGRPDTVSATHHYLGTTTRAPNCNNMDGHNVVGFASLASGVLAVTCFWISGNKIVEADMKITTRESWALSLAHCHGGQPLLEATITHEAGHVFGLAHVSESTHGRLTMSPYLDGPCENNESTLGLGDMLGLEAVY